MIGSMGPPESCDHAAEAVAPDMVALAEAIRCDPELSGQEERAATRCTAILEAHGFAVKRGVAGLPTSFHAVRRIGEGRTRVAFLAEYDALPGIGHGCGHHLIAATSLGAALTAQRAAAEGDDLEIAVFGTPSEETIGGKVVMAEAGLFDGLDGALMFHAGHEWRTVTESLACQSLEVVFGGKAAHAVASPEAGINALEAMLDLFLEVRRIRGASSKEARLPGVVLEGGVRANIVPDRSVARFSARAPTSRELDAIVGALLAAVDRVAAAAGCRRLVRPVDNPYDEMRTNLTIAGILRRELAARGAVVNDGPRPNKGSIDAGNVSLRAPTVHAYLPAAPRALALHTREFGEAATGASCEPALRTAMAALAATALALARDEGTRRAARAEVAAAAPPPRARRWPLLVGEPEARVEC
jgi:amidohydrolase